MAFGVQLRSSEPTAMGGSSEDTESSFRIGEQARWASLRAGRFMVGPALPGSLDALEVASCSGQGASEQGVSLRKRPVGSRIVQGTSRPGIVTEPHACRCIANRIDRSDLRLG